MSELSPNFLSDIALINRIEAGPTILQVVCQATGMGFAAVARVTEGRWIACSVLDQIEFGLKPGGELKVETTICHEIRQTREGVVITPPPCMAFRAISRCRSSGGMARCSGRSAPSIRGRAV